MLENFRQSVERNILRWEDEIAIRREWVRRGWATAEMISTEVAFFAARAEESRYLLGLI